MTVSGDNSAGGVVNSALVEAYGRRIGMAGPVAPTPAGLAQVQRAHRMAIGFENIDVMLGRSIRIDLPALVAKLVHGGRGGYCFEQNRLYGAMLAAMGMANRPLLGRVWLGASGVPGDPPPRAHTLRLVDIDGAPWIADAGFGGSYVPPMPLAHDSQAVTPDGARHRLRQVGRMGDLGGAWRLERLGPAAATDGRTGPDSTGWQAQYSFDLGEVAPVDLEMANHWTSTRPDTRFTSGVIASIVLPDGFAALTGRRLTTYSAGQTGGRSDVMDIVRAADWRSVLADLFGITLTAAEVEQLALF